jgi:hypothetical protein
MAHHRRKSDDSQLSEHALAALFHQSEGIAANEMDERVPNASA